MNETRESKDRYCSPDQQLVNELSEQLAKNHQELMRLQTKPIKESSILDTIKVMDATERVIDETVTEAWLNGHASEFNEQVFSDRLRYQDEEERADHRERAYWANK